MNPASPGLHAAADVVGLHFLGAAPFDARRLVGHARIREGPPHHARPGELLRLERRRGADIRLGVEAQAQHLEDFPRRAHHRRIEVLLAQPRVAGVALDAFLQVDLGTLDRGIDVNRSHRADIRTVAARDAFVRIDIHSRPLVIASILYRSSNIGQKFRKSVHSRYESSPPVILNRRRPVLSRRRHGCSFQSASKSERRRALSQRCDAARIAPARRRARSSRNSLRIGSGRTASARIAGQRRSAGARRAIRETRGCAAPSRVERAAARAHAVLRQLAKAGLDVRRPPIVPFPDRLPDAERFELEPRHREVHELFLRDRRHAKALVILEDDGDRRRPVASTPREAG